MGSIESRKRDNLLIISLQPLGDVKPGVLDGKTYIVNDQEYLMLKLIFRDLCLRGSNPNLLEKSNFTSFIKLPGILGENLYNISITNNNDYMDFKDFCYLLGEVCTEEPSEFSKNMFKICDLKNDKILDQEELKIMVKFT